MEHSKPEVDALRPRPPLMQTEAKEFPWPV